MRTPQSWICASGRAARLVDASRIAKALLPPLSFVATVHGQLAGHVMRSASRLRALPRLVDVQDVRRP
jgi:putative acetyltransferase